MFENSAYSAWTALICLQELLKNKRLKWFSHASSTTLCTLEIHSEYFHTLTSLRNINRDWIQDAYGSVSHGPKRNAPLALTLRKCAARQRDFAWPRVFNQADTFMWRWEIEKKCWDTGNMIWHAKQGKKTRQNKKPRTQTNKQTNKQTNQKSVRATEQTACSVR